MPFPDAGTAVPIVDSHCHLDFPDFDGERDALIARAREAGVTRMVTICTRLRSEPSVRAAAEAHDGVFYAAGTHPMSVAEEPMATLDQLVALSDHPKFVGIGETGLDYHWHKDQPEWQRERFRVHIRAARALKKPLVIHTREAADDTLAILKEEGAEEVGGILHCFTESVAVAQAGIDLGFYVSLSGIVSFKNATQVHDVARSIPLDRLLVETDAPYLAPVPYRGKPNEPAYVKHVAEAIADLRQISLEDVAAATSRNFLTLFPAAAAVLQPRIDR